MRNIGLAIRFDGSAYHGWQRQVGALSIQQVMEEAAAKVVGKQVTVAGCGRTDAGVHALRYICNFHASTNIPIDKMPFALNSVLPCDIRCMEAWEAEERFHAQFSAKGKQYRYLIDNRRIGDVFLRDRTWNYRYANLDVEAMQRACGPFVGEHDFAAFCASGSQAASTVRRIYSLTLDWRDGLLVMDVHGNGFLYNMVRIIVGTLVCVGCGKIDAGDIPDIIDTKIRKRAGITAPPQGLYLKDVFY